MRLPWVWLLIAVGAAAAWIVLAIQVVGGKPVGSDPAPDVVLIVLWVLVGIGLPLLAFTARLIVEVRADEIEIRFIPFLRRTIAIDRIRSCASVRYRPFRRYGGWGIRWWPWRPIAYTVSGNRGVQLELDHGKKLLIGSRRPDELAAALSAARDTMLTLQSESRTPGADADHCPGRSGRADDRVPTFTESGEARKRLRAIEGR